MPPRPVRLQESQERIVVRSSTQPVWLAGLAAGLAFISFGLISYPGNTVALIVGLALGLPLTAAAVCLGLGQTTFDERGIHVGRGRTRHFPWPSSRSSLVVGVTQKGRRSVASTWVYLVAGDGSAVALPGLERFTLKRDLAELEAASVADCQRIWEWAVLRGYTRETGEYTELRDAQMEHDRAHQQRRLGIQPL